MCLGVSFAASMAAGGSPPRPSLGPGLGDFIVLAPGVIGSQFQLALLRNSCTVGA